MSNNLTIFRRPQTLPEVSEAFDASVIVYPVEAAADKPRILYSTVTNEPFLFIGEKVINEIKHFQLRNEITGDMFLLSDEALKHKFSNGEVNPKEVADKRMAKVSNMLRRVFK
ncbi:hypothetical protein N8974_00855 [bacterium]|nr:hypothetical protein [bacterium]